MAEDASQVAELGPLQNGTFRVVAGVSQALGRCEQQRVFPLAHRPGQAPVQAVLPVRAARSSPCRDNQKYPPPLHLRRPAQLSSNHVVTPANLLARRHTARLTATRIKWFIMDHLRSCTRVRGLCLGRLSYRESVAMVQAFTLAVYRPAFLPPTRLICRKGT